MYITFSIYNKPEKPFQYSGYAFENLMKNEYWVALNVNSFDPWGGGA